MSLASSRHLIRSAARAAPLVRGLRTTTVALQRYEGEEPSLIEKAKKMFGISKEHVKKAAKNQGTAMDDIASGRTSVTDEMKEHGKAAKADMKQWGSELKETAKGNMPETAKVRDLPHRYEGEKVRDDTTRVPVKEGSQINKPASGDYRKM